MKEYKIGHEGIQNTGYVFEDALEHWKELGWYVIEDVPEEQPIKYVTKIVKGKETLVPETPLPDKKESDQDITETKEF